MKTIRWWLLGAIIVAAATAALVGPSVRGQQGLPPTKPPQGAPPAVSGISPAANPFSVLSGAGPSGTAPTLPPPGVGLPPVVAGPLSPAPPQSISEQSVGKPAVLAPVPPQPNTGSPSRPALAAVPPPTREAGKAVQVQFGRQEPSVSIEWIGPAMTRLNQPTACQLVVRNTSGFAVQNVVVRHRPSLGVACKASDPQPAVDQGEFVWSLGTLAPAQVRRIDLQMAAHVKGPLTCQATVTFSAAASHRVQVSEPQLHVKLKAPDKVLADEPVTLQFTVSNPGDGAAEGVKLKTLLPEGLEHEHGKTIEVSLGTLAAKETRKLQLICTARGSGPTKCRILVTGDGNLQANDEATVDVLLPKLDLAIAGPKLRYIDRKATYLLKVVNPGSAPAANVVVHGTVPAGFTYHAVSTGGLYDENTRQASWALGDLQPGQSREVALELVPTASGEHKLAAQVTSARGLKTAAETRTVVAGLSALLLDVVDTDDPVEVGSDTTYEIRVANTGTKTETNIEVACTLPEQVEFRSAKAGANMKFTVEGREVLFAPIAKLAPRADTIYRIQVRGKAPGDVRFRVRVRADGLHDPLVRDESTRFYNDDTLSK
jgi:uncharacterized repeat protein (TIGR01451 family)